MFGEEFLYIWEAGSHWKNGCCFTMSYSCTDSLPWRADSSILCPCYQSVIWKYGWPTMLRFFDRIIQCSIQIQILLHGHPTVFWIQTWAREVREWCGLYLAGVRDDRVKSLWFVSSYIEMTLLIKWSHSFWNLPAWNCAEDWPNLVLCLFWKTSLTLNKSHRRNLLWAPMMSCILYEFTSPGGYRSKIFSTVKVLQ